MSKELFSLANLYLKLAKSGPKISVVENTDPILKELSEIKEFEDRVEFAKEQKGWKLLGEGSARIVFQMDEKKVIKVALNHAGLSQNITEADPEKQRYSIVNKVFAFSPKGEWVICANNESLSIQDFKKMTGMGFESFGNALKYKFDSETDKNPPKDFDNIEKNPVFKETAQLILDTNLLVGDCTKLDSWCKVDDKVIIRDTGLSKSVFMSEYDKSGHPDSSGKSYKSDTKS